MKFHLLSNAPELDWAKISAWFLQQKTALVTARRISQTYRRNRRSLRHSQSKEGTRWQLLITPHQWTRLPPWLSGKESTCNGGDAGERGFDLCVGKIPWRRAWQTTPVFLPGKSHNRGAWWATVYGVTKSQTQLSTENSDWTSLWISQSIFFKKL